MLEIKNVYKTFNAGTVNEKVALKGLDLTLEDGDFVTVIGGNGAGKSTMLNAVAGVWPVDMGKILIDGQDVTRLSEHQRAKYIGRVFQDPMMGTAATMQIDENLALAAVVPVIGSWNTRPRNFALLCSGIFVTSTPPINTCPKSGFHTPATALSIVLLPAPLPPITVTKSPSSSLSERLSSARFSFMVPALKVLLIFLISSIFGISFLASAMSC